jgi:hypothetical protein
MASEQALLAGQKRLAASIRPRRGMALNVDAPFQARVQGVLSRGGEEAFGLVRLAAELGGWKKAMRAFETETAAILDRERGPDEAFPWEVVDIGVSRAALRREYERAAEARRGPICPPDGCAVCGLCGMEGWLAGK